MSRTTLRALSVGILSIIGVTLFFVFPSDSMRPSHSVQFRTTQGKKHVDFTAEVAYWKKRITAVGGMAAYREISDSVSGMTVGNQHMVAHTFGQALYEVEGLAGFPVCDTEFSQGCFHQFFVSSIQAEGIDTSLRKVKELCAAQNRIHDKRTCEHGLGHGILGYFGYDLKNLNEALPVCKNNLPSEGLTLGCLGGAFMEYNSRALLQDDTGLRPLSAHSVHHPCDALSGADKEPCVFWQPWWWHNKLSRSMDTTEIFRELGVYCRGYPSSLAKACFAGVGYMAPNREGYQVEQMARLCGATSDDARERIWCWSYATTQMTNQASEFDDVICNGLSGDDLSYCKLHEHDRADIFNVHGRGDF